MGSVGDAYENAMAASFFARLECKLIDRRMWKTFAQARMEIFRSAYIVTKKYIDQTLCNSRSRQAN